MNKNLLQILNSAYLDFELECVLNKNVKSEFFQISKKRGLDVITIGQLPCMEAKSRLVDALNFIKQNGKTTDRCKMKVGVSFGDNLEFKLDQLNKRRFILIFPEEEAYRLFPKRRNRIGSKSITQAAQTSHTITTLTDLYSYLSDVSSDIYGLDFSDLVNNRIYYGYIGGEGYEKKWDEISYLINKWVDNLYYILCNPEFLPQEVNLLKQLNDRHTEFIKTFDSYQSFKTAYKNVEILVDLNPLDGLENLYWSTITPKLMNLISNAALFTKHHITINYDTDNSEMQVKDAKFENVVELKELTLVDCELEGTVQNCDLYDCKVRNSNLLYSTITGDCKIKDSDVVGTYCGADSEFENCYITASSILCGKFKHCYLNEDTKEVKGSKFIHCDNNSTKDSSTNF